MEVGEIVIPHGHILLNTIVETKQLGDPRIELKVTTTDHTRAEGVIGEERGCVRSTSRKV